MHGFKKCRNGKGCSRPPTLILHKIVCIQIVVELSIGWYTIHVLLSLSKLYRSSRTPRLESPKNRAYHKRGFFFLSAPKVPPLFLLCSCYHFFVSCLSLIRCIKSWSRLSSFLSRYVCCSWSLASKALLNSSCL